MKNKKKIQDEYKKKVNRLINLNKAYFDKDKPIVSDSEFDKLKQELINTSKKYTFLKKIKDLNKIVGFKPSKIFEKYNHKVQMLSLSNAFDKNDLVNFDNVVSTGIYVNCTNRSRCYQCTQRSDNFIKFKWI